MDPPPFSPPIFNPYLIWRNEARVPCQAFLSTHGKSVHIVAYIVAYTQPHSQSPPPVREQKLAKDWRLGMRLA